MEKISSYQLTAMIVLFEIGSSSLFELGIKAKQDAWIAVLTAMLMGLPLLAIFLYIQRQAPDQDLVQILRRYFGRYAGGLIAMLYVLYFAYESMRNVRDFGDLIIMSFLTQTPISLIMLVEVILCGYAVFKGIEVFFRVAEFMIPFTLLSYLLLIVMFFSSGLVKMDRLLPVLENGIFPILSAAFPEIVMFPFGQMVLFLMFWNHLNTPSKRNRISIGSYLFTGVFLSVINVLNIAILGTAFASISTIPLLHSVRLIQIADFVERLDAFVILLIFIGIFIKMALFYLGAVLALARLFKTSYRKFVIPVGAAIYFASFLEPNYIFHIWLGLEISVKYIFPVFQIVIPVLLLLMIGIKTINRKVH